MGDLTAGYTSHSVDTHKQQTVVKSPHNANLKEKELYEIASTNDSSFLHINLNGNNGMKMRGEQIVRDHSGTQKSIFPRSHKGT